MNSNDCVFCKIATKQLEVNMIYEDEYICSFMDSDPINEGHVLIIPKEHLLDIDELSEEVLQRIMSLSQRIVKVLKEKYSPDGYSIMQNGGLFNDVGHFHLHVFPRFKSDGFGWTYGEIKEHSLKEVGRDIRKLLSK